MLGKATYLTEKSEESWANFVRDMNDFYERYKTIPVGDGMMFPEEVNVLAERGIKEDDLKAIYKSATALPEEEATETESSGKYLKPMFGHPHFLTVTKKGQDEYDEGKGASQVHEYFHYLNKVMGMGGSGITERMASYRNGDTPEGGWTSQALLEEWMKDPETEYLNLDNPENKGLRTLLKNRLHHEGVVDVREGVGRFLSTMLNDERATRFQDKGLVGGANEMMSYAIQPIVKRTSSIKDKLFSTDWNLEGLDKGLADSIATYLNARELENKGWTEEEERETHKQRMEAKRISN